MDAFVRHINTFDLKVTRTIQTWPAELHPLMVAASLIGHPATAGAVGLILLGYGYLKRQNGLVAASLLALVSLSFSAILKVIWHRVRPDTAHALGLHTYSFPSGHTYSSTVIYGLLAYLAVKHLPAPWNWVVPVLLGILIVVVGLSRVYLGAHYPTDVLGGWILGALVLLLVVKLSGV